MLKEFNSLHLSLGQRVKIFTLYLSVKNNVMTWKDV